MSGNKTYGIELEGFVVDKAGVPQNYIGGKLTIDYLRGEMQRMMEGVLISDYVSVEQVPFHVELKTDVHSSLEAAHAELIAVKRCISEVVGKVGMVFLCDSVLEKEPEKWVPPSENVDSREYGMHEYLKKTGFLPYAVLASVQYNFGGVFNGETVEERWEKLRKMYNQYGKRINELLGDSDGKISWLGLTRMEMSMRLLQGFKGERFKKYSPSEVILPPDFGNIDEMKEWIMAHCGVSSWKEVNSKNIHAFTIKPKGIESTEAPVVLETRYSDSVADEEQLLKRGKKAEGLLDEIYRAS